MPVKLAAEGTPSRLETVERQFRLSTRDYAQLASFRHALRGFLRFSEESAAQEGLSSQHYQAMLILRGWPDGQAISIGELAQQLLIKHHSAVGLVNRLGNEGLVVRAPSAADRRRVELRLSPLGERILAKLAATHHGELRRIGPLMKRFFSEFAPDQPDDAG